MRGNVSVYSTWGQAIVIYGKTEKIGDLDIRYEPFPTHHAWEMALNIQEHQEYD
jgi:hypothetical protein